MFPGKKKGELLITGMKDGLSLVYAISGKVEKSKILNRIIKGSKLCKTVIGFDVVFRYLSCTGLKYRPAKPKKN